MTEMYAVVQWTSAKVTSLGIICESECQTGQFEIGEAITALYRKSQFEAKILFIGELDLMTEKLASLRSAYKPETDSPKGRGHRMVKKKVMEDFVNEDYLKAKETKEVNSTKVKNQLKKKGREQTGDAIIQRIICQRIDDEDDEIEDAEIEESSFVEAHLIASLRENLRISQEEVLKLQKDVMELQNQNHLLQNKLPGILVDLQSAIQNIKRVPLRPVCNSPVPTHHSQYPATPVNRKSPGLSTPGSPPPVVPSSDESHKNTFNIDETIIRRAGVAKSWGALVCNLMTAMFSREQMSSSCLSEKMALKTGKTVVPSEKVDAITKHTQKVFPAAEVGAIRIKMSCKLRDERNAFNST